MTTLDPFPEQNDVDSISIVFLFGVLGLNMSDNSDHSRVLTDVSTMRAYVRRLCDLLDDCLSHAVARLFYDIASWSFADYAEKVPGLNKYWHSISRVMDYHLSPDASKNLTTLVISSITPHRHPVGRTNLYRLMSSYHAIPSELAILQHSRLLSLGEYDSRRNSFLSGIFDEQAGQ